MNLSIRRSGVAVLVLTGLVALSGCTALGDVLAGDDGPTRDPDTSEVTESDEVDVFSLQVGDCISEVESEELQTVRIMPCDEPHTDEIYHRFELTGDELPTTEMWDTADAECIPALEEFVGTAWDDSEVSYWPMSPTQESWDAGDREVLCVAYIEDEELSSSLEGSQR